MPDKVPVIDRHPDIFEESIINSVSHDGSPENLMRLKFGWPATLREPYLLDKPTVTHRAPRAATDSSCLETPVTPDRLRRYQTEPSW
jgi:hypothetical protein